MEQLYAWLLALFITPGALSGLPADAPALVDPMDPMESSLFVDAVFEDIPDGIVTDLCLVESGGCTRPVGIHSRDGWTGAHILPKLMERGRLPQWCPFYWGIEDHPVDLATRGNHGQVAGYALHDLGACVPPEILDVPLWSALRAAIRARQVCRRHYNRESKALRAEEISERTPCTSEDVRHAWAGYGKDRTKVEAAWHKHVPKWRRLRAGLTDWRTRCQKHGNCSDSLAVRPTLEDFRRRADPDKDARW